MMSMKDFVQNEYEIFCTGKLLFELIFVDSFSYLNSKGVIGIRKFRVAFKSATDYRQQVLRRYVNQDKVRATSYVPVTEKEKRKEEFKIRVWVAKQMMVMWYYEEQQAKGVKKLFLEIPEHV